VTKGLPPGQSAVDLRVHDGCLYAAGGDTTGSKDAAGFVARREAGKEAWQLWVASKGAGPVTRLFAPPGDAVADAAFRAFHETTQRLDSFAPDAQGEAWSDARELTRPHEPLGPIATDGKSSLRLPQGGAAIYRFDAAAGAVEPAPLYFLAAAGLGSEHEPFWRPMVLRKGEAVPNPSPAALPLADAPVDVALDPSAPGRFWILDRRGGLTAYDPAADRTAGPFKVADAGVSLSRAAAALLVNDGAGVVVVTAGDLAAAAPTPAAWRTPHETYLAVASSLRTWADTLPAATRGLYLYSGGRPDLGEKAFDDSGIKPPTESVAFRLEKCAEAHQGEIAMRLIKPFLDDPATLDDPKAETAILLTLQRAERWDLLEDFLPRLWLRSPLLGAQVPAGDRARSQVLLLRGTLPAAVAGARLKRISDGELPKARWQWDANTTYRCIARLIKHASRPAEPNR
jgi:hypothetical protein